MDPTCPLPEPNDRWALFLDVDGTLIEIADAPDAVTVDPEVIEILTGLDHRFGHALALVSGRPIATLDRFFAPLRLAVAGLHGLERRTAAGALCRPASDPSALDRVRDRLRRFAAVHRGVLVEDKGLTVALHYRGAPEHADAVARLGAEFGADLGDSFVVQRSKMVLEFRPLGPDKGDVVEAFMAAPPFAGRTPVFIGDDVTDEDGFRAANRMHGHSIKVGPISPCRRTGRAPSRQGGA